MLIDGPSSRLESSCIIEGETRLINHSSNMDDSNNQVDTFSTESATNDKPNVTETTDDDDDKKIVFETDIGAFEAKESGEIKEGGKKLDDSNGKNILQEQASVGGQKDVQLSSTEKNQITATDGETVSTSTKAITMKAGNTAGGSATSENKVEHSKNENTTGVEGLKPRKPIATEETATEKGEEAVPMDLELPDNQDTDNHPAEDESRKASTETSSNNNSTISTNAYSTRGRSTETAAAVEEKKQQERTTLREAFEDSPRPKDPSSGVSFLVEALTEEERRTRTRYLPDVDGMHMLGKNEIKDDVALARSLPTIITPQGSVQTRTERLEGGNIGVVSGTGRKVSNDSMDVDSEENDTPTNTGDLTKIIEWPQCTLTIPSDTFVAPKGVIVGETDGTIIVKNTSQGDRNVSSPSMVDSAKAFNPPRPPESVGGKKKHRMLRWERRPEDIEIDMKNYRRTVQRTRQELQKSEDEYERLEMIDAHLRRHFLNHADLLDVEHKKLLDEMEIEIERLMKESDLAGSRTRSKNLTKIDVVMRDVLTMLTRNEPKDASMDGTLNDFKEDSTTIFPGYGGLNNQAFEDWDIITEVKRMKPCSSWIESGVTVKTPYGEGTVLAVFPPELPLPSTNAKNTVGSYENLSLLTAGRPSEVEQKSNSGKDDKEKYDSLLPLRVKVHLKYGVGIFVAKAITKMESPAHFTDAKLATRWKGMIDSAVKVGPCIDLQGMVPDLKISDSNVKETPHEVSRADIDGEFNGIKSSNAAASNNSFLPAGASLIPTKHGRGNFLYNMEIGDIENTLQAALYDGNGVLGRKSNPAVTKEIRKWEEDEQEYLTLRASILQLKNALYRQRRIRILNERTSNSMNDRYRRAEDLVSEMRSDLKSLKRRLGDELNELGITDDMARQILSQFYQGHQEEDKGDALTPKRSRRASSMIGEMLTNIGNDRREGDPRDSMDDQVTDDFSGDDLETHRPSKKIRSSVFGE